MRTSIKTAIQSFGCSVALIVLCGAASDGSCAPSSDDLCRDTGGTMGYPDNWPTLCGDDPVTTKGPLRRSGQLACMCPVDKPNWQDGVGCLKCFSKRERCETTGGLWGAGSNWPAPCGQDATTAKGPAAANGESVCTCPADKSNWQDGSGCQACAVIHCTGKARYCESIEDSYECDRQKGCKWHGFPSDGCWPETGAQACSTFLTEASCLRQLGCEWTP